LSGVGEGPVLPLGAWLDVSGTSRSFVVGGARRGVVCRPAVCAQQRGVGGRELHWRGLDAATPDAYRQQSCNTRRGRRRCRRRPRRHRRARIGSRAGSWCSPRLGRGRRWKHASQAAAGPAARDITQRARSPVRRVCRRARQGPPTLGCWPRPRAHVPRIEDRRDVSPTETALGAPRRRYRRALGIHTPVPPSVGRHDDYLAPAECAVVGREGDGLQVRGVAVVVGLGIGHRRPATPCLNGIRHFARRERT
jgi:hypothetical protein